MKVKRLLRILEQMEEISDFSVFVKLVDGNLVRDEIKKGYTIDFTMGGNHWAFPDMIPENEIWIDEDMKSEDKVATMAHEFCEMLLMRFYSFDYNDAHNVANDIERIMRKVIPNGDTGDGEEQSEE